MIINTSDISKSLGVEVTSVSQMCGYGELPTISIEGRLLPDNVTRELSEASSGMSGYRRCFDPGGKVFEKEQKKPFPEVKRILKNGDYMTVLWADGDKTVVKRAADEAESDYAAFTAALGIKCYGSNSALKRLVASAEVQGKRKKK